MIAEDPVLAVAVLHRRPEALHEPDHERDRHEDEHRHERVDDEQEYEREDEGGRLREEGRELAGHEGLHGVDVARDASHEVAGGLVGDRGDRQGRDLFVEQRPHHEGELVARDGGQTALDDAEHALHEVDRDDREEDEQERALVRIFGKGAERIDLLVRQVVVDGDALNGGQDELDRQRDHRHEEREEEHPAKTAGQAPQLRVDFLRVAAERADVRARDERASALRAEPLVVVVDDGIARGAGFAALLRKVLAGLNEHRVARQVAAGEELADQGRRPVHHAVERAVAVQDFGREHRAALQLDR